VPSQAAIGDYFLEMDKPAFSAVYFHIPTLVGAVDSGVSLFHDSPDFIGTEDVQRVYEAGYMPHITWEPWFFENPDMINLDDILQSKWNEYIREWAAGASAFGKPMFLRWGHEFNGNWYPWSLARNGEDAVKYTETFKKIHRIFNSAGADNVMWIWCMNANSVPNEPWNDPLKAYPGLTI
jgi:beta-mannanase